MNISAFVSFEEKFTDATHCFLGKITTSRQWFCISTIKQFVSDIVLQVYVRRESDRKSRLPAVLPYEKYGTFFARRL